jgi:CCR4-NOT transcription complex subunit 6
MAAPLTITSARIPSGDAPICGVTLVPYVMVRRSDGQSCNAEDCPEEGSGDARFALRFRWYRSVVNRGGAVCFIHQVPWYSTVHAGHACWPGAAAGGICSTPAAALVQ